MKKFKTLPIEQLKPGIYQPRKHFAKKALQELANSIATQGLIEPLIVRLIKQDHYEIIAGERRWRAAMLAGLSEVPCLIGHYTNQQTAAITLVENIQRQDLNLLEEAQGYQKLCNEFHFSQNEIATLIGKSRSHVTNSLRLLTLCNVVQEKLQNGQLTSGHARSLVGLSPKQQVIFAQKVHQNNWSVRQLEKEIQNIKHQINQKPIQNQDTLNLQTQLAEYLGAPIEIITQPNQGGWLKIKYFNHETLAGLLERIGFSYD